MLLAMLGLVPLIAPYELLVTPAWTASRHPAFVFALLVSLGAMCVSGLLWYAAFAGLEERMVIDVRASRLAWTARAPLVAVRSVILPFDAIRCVDVVRHEWSEGADTFSIRIVSTDGRRIESGTDVSRERVEVYAQWIRTATGVDRTVAGEP